MRNWRRNNDVLTYSLVLLFDSLWICMVMCENFRLVWRHRGNNIFHCYYQHAYDLENHCILEIRGLIQTKGGRK
jgi:hypothetical protein